jgi:hypothetical protein
MLILLCHLGMPYVSCINRVPLPPQAPAHLGNGSDGRTWSSPFRDAVDVITEKLLDRRTIEPVEGFSEEDLIRQKCMQNDIMQNHADYTGRFVCVARGFDEREAVILRPCTEYCVLYYTE